MSTASPGWTRTENGHNACGFQPLPKFGPSIISGNPCNRWLKPEVVICWFQLLLPESPMYIVIYPEASSINICARVQTEEKTRLTKLAVVKRSSTSVPDTWPGASTRRLIVHVGRLSPQTCNLHCQGSATPHDALSQFPFDLLPGTVTGLADSVSNNVVWGKSRRPVSNLPTRARAFVAFFFYPNVDPSNPGASPRSDPA
ncbi:hypothetical protein BX600DRAFT_428884 [Xylariales sp. PMI_506]|nr:hypothetical protein BX600DRAFT_428884 [Xylariales sp. PMI_506]